MKRNKMFYEYECPACGTIEVQQKITEEPLTLCPQCKEKGVENSVKRLISNTSFVLQGGGWASSGYSGK